MWSMMIQSSVFTRIKNEVPKSIKVGTSTIKLSSKNFSTVGSSDTPAVFPFVYFKTLPASEVGSTLEVGVNGGNFGFQIEVTDNKNQTRARNVMKEVSRIMVGMGFKAQGFGEFIDTKDTHRTITRFQRVIGADDKL